MNRAVFGIAQVLEVIGPDAGKIEIEIEASCDEFNLNLRLRYTGAPLLIPDTRPSPREIVASEDGEQRLAGYLLRRSADRISSRVVGERAAAKLLRRVEFHHTPKHASWLNMAEIEIGILSRQCLGRHVASQQVLRSEVDAWQQARQDADQKLGRHYVPKLVC